MVALSAMDADTLIRIAVVAVVLGVIRELIVRLDAWLIKRGYYPSSYGRADPESYLRGGVSTGRPFGEKGLSNAPADPSIWQRPGKRDQSK